MKWFTGSPCSNAHNFYKLFSIHSNSQTCMKKQWVCLSIFFTQLFPCCTSFRARNSLIRIFNMHHFTATIGKITYTCVLHFGVWVFDLFLDLFSDLFSNFSLWKLGKAILEIRNVINNNNKRTFLFA